MHSYYRESSSKRAWSLDVKILWTDVESVSIKTRLNPLLPSQLKPHERGQDFSLMWSANPKISLAPINHWPSWFLSTNPHPVDPRFPLNAPSMFSFTTVGGGCIHLLTISWLPEPFPVRYPFWQIVCEGSRASPLWGWSCCRTPLRCSTSTATNNKLPSSPASLFCNLLFLAQTNSILAIVWVAGKRTIEIKMRVTSATILQLNLCNL